MVGMRGQPVDAGGDVGPGQAAIQRAVRRQSGGDYDIGIGRTHANDIVVRALRSAVIGSVEARPVLRAIGGAVEAEESRGRRIRDAGEHSVRTRWRYGKRDSSGLRYRDRGSA